jgi:CubicO group peptidase (beta-lactamase class C family)
MMKKFWRRAGFAVAGVVVFGLGVGFFTPYGAYAVHGPTVGAGISAQLACAGAFVSNRPLDDVTKRDVIRLSPLTRWNTYKLDRENRSISVTALGLVTRTSIYRPNVGCTLLVDADKAMLRQQAASIPESSSAPRAQSWPLGDTVDLDSLPSGANRAALDRAVSDTFRDETPDRDIDTRAIVVVYNGRIVAERYERGFDKNTRLLGWSMSKSVTAALVGTLIANGQLALDAPPPVPEWNDKTDPRSKITLRQLLNMSSGLKFNEAYDPGSDSTKMLFESHDMGAYAAGKPLEHGPGTFWSYSSGTANILSRLVFQQTGATLAAYNAYARRALFDLAGMSSAVMEPDESGSFVGSSYLYATARDWARFGLLFLNRGVINRNRILSESFVDFVRSPAPADTRKGYGGQFWLNGLAEQGSKNRQLPHLPADEYAAEGHNDEFVAIFPSRNTVIVRLGWTVGGASFDRDRHFAAILNALPATAR